MFGDGSKAYKHNSNTQLSVTAKIQFSKRIAVRLLHVSKVSKFVRFVVVDA